MSSYTKTTNFTAKDNLTSGDPAKVIKGAEFDTEFNSIETAVNSKANSNNTVLTGTADVANVDAESLNTASLSINNVEVTATSAELNTLDGITSTTAELNKLDGFTGTVDDLNYAKDLRATGVTTTEFDKLDGLTATTSELNTLDGITATTTELNYTDGVTSNIQTQLDAKASSTASPTITLSGDLSGSATLTNLGSATLTATVADDSHNHVISNVDGLQTALDGKATSAQGALADTAVQPNDNVTFGTVTSDGLTVDGTLAAPPIMRINNTGGSWVAGDETGRLQFYTTDGSGLGAREVASIRSAKNSAGSVTCDGTLEFWTSPYNTVAKKSMEIDGNTGDVLFYEDTGTTAKFVWDASAENISIGSIEGVANGSLSLKTTTSGHAISLEENSGTERWQMGVNVDGDLEFINSADANPSIVFDDSGNVGIGTSAPVTQFNIDYPVSSSSDRAMLSFSRGRSDRYASIGLLTGANSNFNGLSFYTCSNTNTPTQSMVIDSAGNVGIGTSSPSERLSLVGASPKIQLTDTGTFYYTKLGYDGLDAYTNTNGSAPILFKTGGSERARIDSSGNLLVGKTSLNSSVEGIELRQDGRLGATYNQSNPAFFNRLGNDGEIVRLLKDGTTVGSIGSVAGVTLAIDGGTGRSGLQFATSVVQPRKSGALSNGGVDLGQSDYRFKDLYLSGGVYLGGTDSANKLDDYEEGNWTGTIGGSTSNPTTEVSVSGRYVKVGAVVTVQIQFNNYSNVGASGEIRINGLPFINEHNAVGSGWSGRATSSDIICKIDNTSSSIRFLNGSGNAQNWATTGTGTYTGATITYRTTA